MTGENIKRCGPGERRVCFKSIGCVAARLCIISLEWGGGDLISWSGWTDLGNDSRSGSVNWNYLKGDLFASQVLVLEESLLWLPVRLV